MAFGYTSRRHEDFMRESIRRAGAARLRAAQDLVRGACQAAIGHLHVASEALGEARGHYFSAGALIAGGRVEDSYYEERKRIGALLEAVTKRCRR